MKGKKIIIGGFLLLLIAGLTAVLWVNRNRERPRESYPLKEITVICPWVQGGGTDLTLRALCASAEEELGVPVNVVNKAGENGALGFSAIKEAEKDGYTLGMITYELNTLPREGLLDFTYQDIDPLIMVNADAVALAAKVDAPYSSVNELVEYARKHPGEITVAQATPGSVWHVGALLFVDMAGIDVKFLPFEGTANAVTAAANGYTEVVAASVAEAKVQVDAGQLKLLGIMDTKRAKLYPDIPTFTEQGYDITYYTWRGLALPKGVPAAEKELLEQAFSKAVQSKRFTEEMESRNLDITYLDHTGFQEFLGQNYEEVGLALEKIGLLKQ